MSVKVGHASIDERGKATGGKAGDQNGKEVCTRYWYRHSKGWVTLRCLIAGMAEWIAYAMEVICADNDVGYDQSENQTLWKLLKENGFDIHNISKDVETDCARLVRVCVQYAANKVGLNVTIPDFYTATLASVLVSTGLFEKLTDDKYNTQDAYLERGMIQVTKTKGHTWIILSNGSKVSANKPTTTTGTKKEYSFGDRTLKKGMVGNDVEELQKYLNNLNYNCGTVDGDFGSKTLNGVKEFQKAKKLEVDGIVGKNTIAAINKLIVTNEESKYVVVTGNSVNVRKGNSTSYDVLFVASKNDKFKLLSTSAENGWYQIETNKGNAWISNTYSEIVSK